MINTAKRHIETIHGLPEGTRRFLAGCSLLLAACAMFFSWRYSLSLRLTDLSQPSKIATAKRLASEPNVLVMRDRGDTRQEITADGRTVSVPQAQQIKVAVGVRTPGMFDWIFSGIGKVGDTALRTTAGAYESVAGLFTGKKPAVVKTDTAAETSSSKSLFSTVIVQTRETLQATSSILEKSADAVSGVVEGGIKKIRELIDSAKIQ